MQAFVTSEPSEPEDAEENSQQGQGRADHEVCKEVHLDAEGARTLCHDEIRHRADQGEVSGERRVRIIQCELSETEWRVS